MNPQDSISHHSVANAEFTDTASAVADTGHVHKWRFDNLPEVPGMYQRDSLPELQLNGFHKKTTWKGTFDSYVSTTQHYHEELPPVRDGVVGVPVEYTIASDSFLSMGLFICILLTILTASRSWRFLRFQLKNIFRTPREDSAIMRETSSEMRYQVYFSLQGVLLMGLFTYTLARYKLADGEDFSVGDYQLIGIYFLIFLLYRLVCELLEVLVLPVYFTDSQRMIWAGARLFFIALQGALLLPVALVYFYFHLNIETAITAALAVIGTTMMLRYYKAYRVFFQKNGNFLQFFLYLCTLKAVPIALLTVVALFIAEYLKINI